MVFAIGPFCHFLRVLCSDFRYNWSLVSASDDDGTNVTVHITTWTVLKSIVSDRPILLYLVVNSYCYTIVKSQFSHRLNFHLFVTSLRVQPVTVDTVAGWTRRLVINKLCDYHPPPPPVKASISTLCGWAPWPQAAGSSHSSCMVTSYRVVADLASLSTQTVKYSIMLQNKGLTGMLLANKISKLTIIANYSNYFY